MVPYIDDGAPAALIYADAFYQPGEVRRKAGHIAAEVQVNPEAASQVFYDCGTALAPVESIRGAVQPSSGEGDGPGAMRFRTPQKEGLSVVPFWLARRVSSLSCNTCN